MEFLKFSVKAIFTTVLFRLLIGLSKYSGQGQSPMYGDYEAQRHWQEITYNLPALDWYVDGPKNDLGYWGLDYPPLSAYHSYVVSLFAKEEWVKLFFSRGTEGDDHKLFMRLSVIISDLLIYIPAVLVFSYKFASHPKANAIM